MTGPRPDRPKSAVSDSISGPINHRDASNSAGSLWTKPPTAITVPASRERLPQASRRLHDNPFFRSSNNPGPKPRPGNPNVSQTILAKPPDLPRIPNDVHPRKRQRLDPNVSSGPTLNGASSSFRPPRSDFFETDVQVIEPPRTTNSRTHPIPNDAEIIDVGTSSDDPGEPVRRVVKSSSPDPLLLKPGNIHAFETHPTEYSVSTSKKGKGRAKELPEVVEASEEDEISEFSSTAPASHLSDNKKSPRIPKNFVQSRKKLFENTHTSTPIPVVIRYPIRNTVQVDLITKTVVSQMKKKDEGARGNQRSTSLSDNVGMSSSNFQNSPHAKDTSQDLPLQACCIGLHLIQHSDSAPLKLAYDTEMKVKITFGQSLAEKIEFKLDNRVESAIIVNDLNEPLRENVVIQLITSRGQEWKGFERKFKGFEGGGDRSSGFLTFLFSTAKSRGFSATNYHQLVTGIKKAIKESAIETVQPSKGKAIWEFVARFAGMFRQMESRDGKEEGYESSRPESKPPSRDSGPSASYRRSTRQSAICSSKVPSPPLPPAQPEPDEIILMYPPTGRGAVSIMNSDLKRLQPEEYLNDTLIEFGLKLWLSDLRAKDSRLADQIHVFSSFFYKKLNNRKNPSDGYKSVRKWTSKVDLFKKKYVIVPINENIHWYLAIIYEPGHTLQPPLPPTPSMNARSTRRRKQTQEHAESNAEDAVASEHALTELSLQRSHFLRLREGESHTSSSEATHATTPSTNRNEDMVVDTLTTFSQVQIRDSSPDLQYPSPGEMDIGEGISTVDTAPNPIIEAPNSAASEQLSVIPSSQIYRSISQRGESNVIAGNEDNGEEDQEQEAEVDDMLAVAQSPVGDWPAQTYIFTLDSLGSRHPQAIKVLKQYLAWEANDKRSFGEVRTAVGKQVQVPIQPNSWDCGVYLLHFVQVLMASPSEFLEKILSVRGTMASSERKKMWKDHEIPSFRDHLMSRIIQLSEDWKARKTIRDGEANKREGGDVMEAETLSSEGEVDIVEDISGAKSTPGPKRKRPATRLRG